jgi:hypothetical protein
MNGRRLVSWGLAVWRTVSGRWARRIYTVLLLMCISLSVGLRCRTYLLTRRIQAVLAGLAQVRVDQTTESQLQTIVPYLRSLKIEASSGLDRQYCASISNDHEGSGGLGLYWVPHIFFSSWTPQKGPIQNKWSAMPLPLKVAYVLGWRHLTFRTCITTLNGVVAGAGYALEPDLFLGWPASELVVVRSVHGFWMRHRRMPVQSADDESPDFRFGAAAGEFSMFAGDDATIGVAYTARASRELVSHVFRVDLSCFWGIRGCGSVRQVVPLLWADRLRIAQATVMRLKSGNPCPDRILDGRVRTLPDLNVALLEVVDSRYEVLNYEGDRTQESVTEYRLAEVIRGHFDASEMTAMRYRQLVGSPTGKMPNRAGPFYPKRGERFLFFSGVNFDSCRIVPATPSAEFAVRTAASATKRHEDLVGWGRM